MKYEDLEPLLVWRVGSIRGWTPMELASALSVEGVLYSIVPDSLLSLLVGFRRRRQQERVALCRRFLKKKSDKSKRVKAPLFYASKQEVIWIDVDVRAPHRRQSQSPSRKRVNAMAVLSRDFLQWSLANHVPLLGFTWGTYGFVGGIPRRHFAATAAWFKSRGIEFSV